MYGKSDHDRNIRKYFESDEMATERKRSQNENRIISNKRNSKHQEHFNLSL